MFLLQTEVPGSQRHKGREGLACFSSESPPRSSGAGQHGSFLPCGLAEASCFQEPLTSWLLPPSCWTTFATLYLAKRNVTMENQVTITYAWKGGMALFFSSGVAFTSTVPATFISFQSCFRMFDRTVENQSAGRVIPQHRNSLTGWRQVHGCEPSRQKIPFIIRSKDIWFISLKNQIQLKVHS